MTPPLTPQTARAFLERVYREVFSPDVTPEIVARYYTEDAVQIIDGQPVDMPAFLTRLEGLRQLSGSATFAFTDVLTDGARIAETHLVRIENPDGSLLYLKVIALHTLRDGRICGLDELTRALDGPEAVAAFELAVRG